MLDNIKKAMCVLLLLCTVLLSGCGPTLSFLNKKEQGLYPDTSDFPNTKWICREIDMCINMFKFEEELMIGTYEVNSVSYRVVATFEFDEIDFEFYSFANNFVSEHSNSNVHCEPNPCGYIYTNYRFDKDAQTIVCTIRNCNPVDNEIIPETLTFEKVGSIAQNPNMRWCAQEIDMYLDSFSDVDGYFSGEIAIGGEKHYVHALEVSDNYFVLSVENSKLNNLRPGTTSPLIRMHFEIEDNQIVAKVCDEYLTNAVEFPYWPYGDSVITFKPLAS